MKHVRTKAAVKAALGGLVVAGAIAAPHMANAAVDRGDVSGDVLGSGLDLDGYQAVLTNDQRTKYAPVAVDGSYAFNDVPVGTYEAGLYYYDEETGEELFATGGSVTVTVDQTTDHDIGYALVHGTITAGGLPVDGGSVSVLDPGDDPYSGYPAYVEGDGTYQAVAIVDGEDSLLFVDSWTAGYADEWYAGANSAADATPLDLEVGDNELVDIALRKTAKVKGSFSSFPSGATWIDREVGVTTPDGEWVNGASIRRDGTFTVRGVVPGSYIFSFARASGPALTAGTYFQGVIEGDIGSADMVEVGTDGTLVQLSPTATIRGAKITGKVVNRDGDGRAHLKVLAVPVDSAHSTRTAVTKRSGEFTIAGLSPGTDYKVFVWNAEFPDPRRNACKEKKLATVAVTASKTYKIGKKTFTARTGRC